MSSCTYDSPKKSNTNFVSCTIVMSLKLDNFSSKSLKFN